MLGWAARAVYRAAKAANKEQHNNQYHGYLTNLGLNPKKVQDPDQLMPEVLSSALGWAARAAKSRRDGNNVQCGLRLR
jgi:hypothetical protein